MAIFIIFTVIVWCSSFVGLAWMIYKKAPVLAHFSEKRSKTYISLNEISYLSKKITERIWHKLLIKLHIISLKTENKIFSLRKKIGEISLPSKSKSKSTASQDSYWQELKKAKRR